MRPPDPITLEPEAQVTRYSEAMRSWKSWRISTWILLVLLAAAIAGATTHIVKDSRGEYYDEAGYVSLLTIAFFVWVVRVLLGWRDRRRNYRPCPRCGRPVRVGVLECEECGFAFSTIGGTPA
jgi:hypothetical protein